MSRLSPTILDALARALSTAYVNQTELDALLRPLGERFDDLTSQKESLLTNARQIVFAAQDKGWSDRLLQALLADRPNNAAVRALADLKPAIVDVPLASKRRNPNDRPSLTCGRGNQFNSVLQCAQARTHQVIVVPGCIGQATMHFRDRVQAQFSTEVSRSIVTVSWPSPPPKSLPELLGQLAFALDKTADVSNLEQRIADRLAYKNLVVLHPCLKAGFRGDHFRDYYTQWWPSVLAKMETASHVKCLQPVEWPINPSVAQSWWQRLIPDDQPKGETEARTLIGTLTRHKMGVKILSVDELLNLQPHEIEKFLEASEFTDDEKVYLSDQLLSGPQVPELMFETIDRQWRDGAGNE